MRALSCVISPSGRPWPECPGGGLVAELFKSISENITFVFICKGAHMMACGTNFFNQPQGQIKNEKGLYVSIFNSHMQYSFLHLHIDHLFDLLLLHPRRREGEPAQNQNNARVRRGVNCCAATFSWLKLLPKQKPFQQILKASCIRTTLPGLSGPHQPFKL